MQTDFSRKFDILMGATVTLCRQHVLLFKTNAYCPTSIEMFAYLTCNIINDGKYVRICVLCIGYGNTSNPRKVTNYFKLKTFKESHLSSNIICQVQC